MAVSFNGTTQGLDCSNAGVLNFADSGAFAMCGWVSVATLTPASAGALFGRGYDGKTAFIWGVESAGSNGLTFYSFDGATTHGYNNGTAGGIIPYSVLGWSINVFHHIYGEYDGTKWTVAFDGNFGLVGSQTEHGGYSNTAKFEIGCLDINGTPGQFAAGCVADVALFNGPLTTLEVTNLGNGSLRPSGVTSKTLLGYWPMDTLANPELDSTSNHNNGAFIGSPTLCGNSPTYTGTVVPVPTFTQSPILQVRNSVLSY